MDRACICLGVLNLKRSFHRNIEDQVSLRFILQNDLLLKLRWLFVLHRPVIEPKWDPMIELLLLINCQDRVNCFSKQFKRDDSQRSCHQCLHLFIVRVDFLLSQFWMSKNHSWERVDSLIWVEEDLELHDLLWRDDHVSRLDLERRILTLFRLNSVELKFERLVLEVKSLTRDEAWIHNLDVEQITLFSV